MRSWLQDFGLLLLVWIAIQIVFDVVFCSPWQWERRTARRLLGHLPRSPRDPVVPPRRPIEQVGPDVRRLHAAFHREGMRFAKWEGCRLAYDAVLAEAAEILEIEHLLSVLPPGDDRDRERERIERLLDRSGLSPHPRAA